jgi:DNA-binding GntR family transcriptional regulator
MLTEKAYQNVKSMIFEQKLAPGQKLTYGELSKTFKMSPTPVINALHRLEREGMVVSAPFKGFYVKRIDYQEAWDLFGVREALETYAVEQAISVADPDDLLLLEEKMAEHASYKPKVYDRKRFMLDAEFHIQLASMTRNQVLTRQLSTIFEHFYTRFKFDTVPLDRLESAAGEHRAILEKIKRKDTNGSRDAMRIHVQNARNHIIQIVGDEQNPERASA